jgi:hypothetical protein
MESCDTSSAIMEQLGELVQLQSLYTWNCRHEEFSGEALSYGALSNLQSLHTLECQEDWGHFRRHLACIPMEDLRNLMSGDFEVTNALLTSDPPVQIKVLCLTHCDNYSLLWNYLARMTSLAHLSLPNLRLPHGRPSESLNFPFQELTYLHIHVAFTPRFANQPLKMMKIDTESGVGQLMVEVRQHWQGIVFPHVECLEIDRPNDELEKIPIEFWKEFLLNVNEVVSKMWHVFFFLLPFESMLIFYFHFVPLFLDNRSTRSLTSESDCQ